MRRYARLYYFDSSDEESDDYDISRLDRSTKELKDNKPYLTASYMLTKISQSLLEQNVVKEKYIALREKVKSDLAAVIPHSVDNGDYIVNNKALGNILFDPSSSFEKLNNLELLDDEAHTCISRVLVSYENLKTGFLDNNQSPDIEEELHKVCVRLLKLPLNNKNAETFSVNVLAKYNGEEGGLELAGLLKELQRAKKTTFKSDTHLGKLLGNKTVNDIIYETNDKIFRAELEERYDIFCETRKEIIGDFHYTEFLRDVLSYLNLLEEDKVDDYPNKILLEDMLLVLRILKPHSLLPTYFSYKNEVISKELMAYREMDLPVFSHGEDYFADFKLNHRIMKAKAKTAGFISTKQQDIMSARNIKDTTVSIIDRIKIYKGGTRGDYEFLPDDIGGSYENVAIELSTFSNTSRILVDNIKNVVCGHPIESLSKSQQLYLYRVVHLLFNCEGERNVSTFLSNITFFDLVQHEIYKIEELPQKLPMTMKGAIQASRYTLDVLGGKYGGDKTNSYLATRQYFDYKTTRVGAKKSTVESAKEKLLHYELVLKDSRLLRDWIKYVVNKEEFLKGKLDELDEIIMLINSINRIQDHNTEYFNEKYLGSTDTRNKECLSILQQKLGVNNEIIERFNEITNIRTDNAISNQMEVEQKDVTEITREDVVNFLNLIQSLAYSPDYPNRLTYLMIKDKYQVEPSLKRSSKKESEDHDSAQAIKVPRKSFPEFMENFVEQFREFFNSNLTQKLLEFVLYYIDTEITEYYTEHPIEVTSVHFQEQGKLIREWYNVKSDYLEVIGADNITLEL